MIFEEIQRDEFNFEDVLEQVKGDFHFSLLESHCALGECGQPLKPYENATEVQCTNPECDRPTVMHNDCFKKFENSLLEGLAQQARYKTASPRKIKSHLWAENAYTLVYKLCTCECSKGIVRPAFMKPKNEMHHRLRTETGESNGSSGYGSAPGASPSSHPSPPELKRPINEAKPKAGTMGEFIDSEIGVIIKNAKVKRKGKRSIVTIGTVVSNLQTDKHVSDLTPKDLKLRPMRHTNFRHRLDYKGIEEYLPPHKFNSGHIKVDCEGYAMEDMKTYVLSNLSMCGADEIFCSICRLRMPVYDQFPLVNGLMFLSPDLNSEEHPVYVKIDGQNKYIHGVCVQCLEGNDVECCYCRSTWSGGEFQIGTLYKFDIFAAKPCCERRVCCKNCRKPLGDWRVPRAYSHYSRRERCESCFAVDFHCINPLNTYRLRPHEHKPTPLT